MNENTNKEKKINFWEIVGYINLALCVIGQITVGYVYLFAQVIFLASNIFGTARDFKMNLPTSNKVRDIIFSGITVALIVIKIFG